MEDTSQVGVTMDELEAKRKARMERFGVSEVKEAQRSVSVVSNGGKLKNRRKQKLLKKLAQKQGGGKKSLVLEGNRKKKNRQGNRDKSRSGKP